MRARRRSTTLLAALALCAAGVGSSGVAPSQTRGPEASLDLSPMTYVASRGSATEVVLEAEHAAYRPGESAVHLRGVRLEVAAQADVVGFEMTCERGVLDLDASDFHAVGRVRGRTRDGRRIATEELHYRHSDGLIASDQQVEIREETGVFRGGGFRYHVREGRFRILGGATVVQTP